jgi:hypothetical protein
MAEKKKNNNLLYLLLGLGVAGGLYFFTKKKGETVEKEDKPTSDVGNGKNDKPEIKKDDLGQPQVNPTLPGDPGSDFGYNPDRFKSGSDIIFDTGVVKTSEPTITTSASSGKKSSPIVETVNFTV